MENGDVREVEKYLEKNVKKKESKKLKKYVCKKKKNVVLACASVIKFVKKIPERDWMSMPQGPPNCPPGLEYLMSLSNLFVKQKVEFLEAITGYETNNKFTIKNERGEKFYWAVEESDLCSRQCLGQVRPFEMRIMDSYQNEVIHLNRPLNCGVCCFPCCLQKMEVCAPPGNLIGTVEQEWSFLTPKFKIKDWNGETVLRIEGPCCNIALCGQSEFQILSRDGQVQVGKISKEWSGFARELFTDADYFGISFPLDLDVKMKAVMLGALFLIDAMYFENNKGLN
ncbi:Phospholipid scramblase, putative [Pediculus humanus corporis]|uniref:Phospholipid scramblase n=1 Tax=Pediculus humanus subsp. corporis TaxID=121224 RepID=E0VXM0_PEDHC|nr:Phospholipid scramblase, putative [Pediculus humanus corporis]EEB18126.1 Phospholipid scramblase, putative [Pediculus humanus corporis]